ncbi:MAG: flagellar biosynthesis anti-sigma factor FlgM [Eubacteriales bacterium]|nr:flagellar biosynthesis anti-sigma factor FlgM [Eubacteriales bacterium]
MKINEVYSVVGQYQTTRTQRTQAQKPVSMGTDKVEISGFAKIYSDAMAAAHKDAPADSAYQARVSDIAARMQAGTYNVSAEDVSAKILGL